MEFEIICKCISEVLSVDSDEIRPDTTFMDDLGADSLDLYQIIMKVEEAFEVTISPDDAYGIHTVQDALDLIHTL